MIFHTNGVPDIDLVTAGEPRIKTRKATSDKVRPVRRHDDKTKYNRKRSKQYDGT